MSAVAALIRASGRPWWEVRYRGGRVVSEWDTILGLGTSLLPEWMTMNGRRSRWEELPKSGMIGARLLCPDGQVGEIVAARDAAIFQFKVGQLRIGGERRCEAQVVGVIDNDQGDCSCFAWETAEWGLVRFTDNVHAFRYRTVGPLGIESLGLKV